MRVVTTHTVDITVNLGLELVNRTTYSFMLIPVTPLAFPVTIIARFTLLALLKGATTGFWAITVVTFTGRVLSSISYDESLWHNCCPFTERCLLSRQPLDVCPS